VAPLGRREADRTPRGDRHDGADALLGLLEPQLGEGPADELGRAPGPGLAGVAGSEREDLVLESSDRLGGDGAPDGFWIEAHACRGDGCRSALGRHHTRLNPGQEERECGGHRDDERGHEHAGSAVAARGSRGSGLFLRPHT
jgi:hypothetical protein